VNRIIYECVIHRLFVYGNRWKERILVNAASVFYVVRTRTSNHEKIFKTVVMDLWRKRIRAKKSMRMRRPVELKKAQLLFRHMSGRIPLLSCDVRYIYWRNPYGLEPPKAGKYLFVCWRHN
jgi:hypothetical protein